MKRHTNFIFAATLIILLVLFSLPARAQDTGGATSSALYLPAISYTFPLWFTDPELDDAMTRAGYDVETASMHTVCTLDPSATPPHDIRYRSCEQYLIGDTPTEGTQHYIWYVRLGDGVVHGIEVGSTYAATDGASEAPCYLDVDGEAVCG